ncbi:hypothetical protein ON010_g5017 [Phytophthora cinnamomi]|nr:hypothetical protein ON010_g5017 [Phytophthora cinnamomi]
MPPPCGSAAPAGGQARAQLRVHGNHGNRAKCPQMARGSAFSVFVRKAEKMLACADRLHALTTVLVHGTPAFNALCPGHPAAVAATAVATSATAKPLVIAQRAALSVFKPNHAPCLLRRGRELCWLRTDRVDGSGRDASRPPLSPSGSGRVLPRLRTASGVLSAAESQAYLWQPTIRDGADLVVARAPSWITHVRRMAALDARACSHLDHFNMEVPPSVTRPSSSSSICSVFGCCCLALVQNNALPAGWPATMSGRSTSSRRDSESESEISIAPSSIDSISGLRRSKPRHVIYEDSEAEEGESRHSELDLSLYDTDEIQDSERRATASLWAATASSPYCRIRAVLSKARTRRSRSRRHATELPSTVFQQLRHLQRQQHEQIREQQERFPRAYEAASISSTSFYKYLRDAFAGGGAYGGDTGSHRGGETDSSRSRGFHATASYARSSRAPMGSETNAQSNLSNASSQDAPLGTPNDSYDVLGTPPGEPPAVRPSRQPSRTHSEQTRDFTPFDEIYSQALQHLPRSMNSYLLAVLMAAGFGIGFAALSADPPAAYGYWLNQIGTLYIRLVNCAAVPMGICQVIFSVSTLTARGALQRLWLKTLGFHFVLSLLSVLMAVIIAAALRHSLKQTDELIFEASSTRFGFQCSNSKYLELNGTSLACDSDTFDDANSTAAVFPSFVDVNGVLGLPETITKLTLTQWVYLLGERYVPNNVVQALSADYYISSMMIATVLGVAVTRSFRGGGALRALVCRAVHDSGLAAVGGARRHPATYHRISADRPCQRQTRVVCGKMVPCERACVRYSKPRAVSDPVLHGNPPPTIWLAAQDDAGTALQRTTAVSTVAIGDCHQERAAFTRSPARCLRRAVPSPGGVQPPRAGCCTASGAHVGGQLHGLLSPFRLQQQRAALWLLHGG